MATATAGRVEPRITGERKTGKKNQQEQPSFSDKFIAALPHHGVVLCGSGR